MRAIDRLGLAFPPLIIRLALAVTFIWAGLGKVISDIPVNQDQVARLASIGVTPNPPANPGEPSTTRRLHGLALLTAQAAAVPAAPTPSLPTDPANPADATNPSDQANPADPSSAAPTPATPTPAGPSPIWPPELGQGPWPVRLAWAASITELLAGFFLLIGFMSRLSGLAIAGVMATALWLTHVGPAVQSGNAALGFLPSGRDWHDPAAWTAMGWQLALLAMGLSVLFSGSGMLAVDRVLFGPPGGRLRDEFDDDHAHDADHREPA